MKVTLNTNDQIIVDREGGPKKEVEVVYVNTAPEKKTFEGKVDNVRVSVDSGGDFSPFPIRISILHGVGRGLPMGAFNSMHGRPGDVMAICDAKRFVATLEKAIEVAEANDEL